MWLLMSKSRSVRKIGNWVFIAVLVDNCEIGDDLWEVAILIWDVGIASEDYISDKTMNVRAVLVRSAWDCNPYSWEEGMESREASARAPLSHPARVLLSSHLRP